MDNTLPQKEKAQTMSRNLLAEETSPYLLQHRSNPVNWRPWGDDAFADARRADKPVLLSVGYSACHWCHVMAHESFEDDAIAALMNELFVCIKVDREERPDVDVVYQHALAMLGEQGGWPLTMFLTPDAEPFWGGTYFPPEPRYGRAGFPDILRRVAELHKTNQSAVRHNADAIREALNRPLTAAGDPDHDKSCGPRPEGRGRRPRADPHELRRGMPVSGAGRMRGRQAADLRGRRRQRGRGWRARQDARLPRRGAWLGSG